jgi:hypothetical protein
MTNANKPAALAAITLEQATARTQAMRAFLTRQTHRMQVPIRTQVLMPDEFDAEMDVEEG